MLDTVMFTVLNTVRVILTCKYVKVTGSFFPERCPPCLQICQSGWPILSEIFPCLSPLKYIANYTVNSTIHCIVHCTL